MKSEIKQDTDGDVGMHPLVITVVLFEVKTRNCDGPPLPGSLHAILRENIDFLTTASSKHRVPLYIRAGYCASEAKTPLFFLF